MMPAAELMRFEGKGWRVLGEIGGLDVRGGGGVVVAEYLRIS